MLRPIADLRRRSHHRQMTDVDTRLLRSLVLMCDQYLRSPDGFIDHQHMSAGEEAVAVLAALGFITPSARGGEWSEEGLALLKA